MHNGVDACGDAEERPRWLLAQTKCNAFYAVLYQIESIATPLNTSEIWRTGFCDTLDGARLDKCDMIGMEALGMLKPLAAEDREWDS